MILSLNERENKILTLLTDNSTISVNDMSEQLGVSRVTIRSDLNSLAEKGVLVRSRGGAVPAFHPDVLAGMRHNVEQKQAIARYAANLINEGDTIMLDDGTTIALVPRYLMGKRNLHIVSNSSLILPYCRISPGFHLTLVGGEFRPESEAFVGPTALASLEKYHVKYSFVGTEGFSIKYGLTSQQVESGEIIRKMADHCDKVILLADSSKYNRQGFIRIMPLSEIDMLITDKALPDSDVAELEEQGCEVIRV